MLRSLSIISRLLQKKLGGNMMILNKRILRELKQNFARYSIVFVIVAISMCLVVGIAGSAEIVIKGVSKHSLLNVVEDGHFSLFVNLSVEENSKIEDSGVILEEQSYLDFNINGSTLRIFTNREEINTFELDEGRLADTSGEIAIEKNYSKANNLTIGDTIDIGNDSYTIVGIGSSPDYDNMLLNLTDASSNSLLFGNGFVIKNDYNRLIKSDQLLGTEYIQYAYKLPEDVIPETFRDQISKLEFKLDDINDPIAHSFFSSKEKNKNDFTESIKTIYDTSNDLSESANELVDVLPSIESLEGIHQATEKLSDSGEKLKSGADNLNLSFNEFSDEYLDFSYINLKEFIESSDNVRINASADDIQVNRTGALIAGVIILVLLAYILSAFITNTIEKEKKVIGTLYSMGFNKRELLSHFLILPSLICLIGGLFGTVLGFASMDSYITTNSNYFSYPVLNRIYPMYLIFYGILVPFVMAITINAVLINKKLSKEPLALMRKQQVVHTTKQLNLGDMKFINRFRLKLFMVEIKSNLTICIGIFISLLLVMLALCIYSALTNVVTDTKNDVKFEYMYYLAYPEDDAPENAEKAYMNVLNKETLGHDFAVSILGVDTNSKSFPYNLETNTNQLFVSTSVANKFDIKVGDDFDLTDKINNIIYTFKVKEIVDYAPGLFVFMELPEMRELFGENDEYYNVLFSQVPLSIDAGRIHSITTRQVILNASEIFMSLMENLINVLVIASVIIFVAVMYLMIKMIIERQTSNISMFKILGYTDREISKLYLSNNLYIVSASAIIFIPLSRWIIANIYPYLVANRSVGFNLSFSHEIYIFIVALIIGSFFFALLFAKLKLNKITINEILKERE